MYQKTEKNLNDSSWLNYQSERHVSDRAIRTTGDVTEFYTGVEGLSKELHKTAEMFVITLTQRNTGEQRRWLKVYKAWYGNR